MSDEIETESVEGDFKDEEYPRMVGAGSMKANQEIHIFLAPLNPDEDVLKRYYEAVADWNQTILPILISQGYGAQPMKPCHLALIFRKGGVDTKVRVMQSARYFRCDNPEDVVNQSHADAQFFQDHGFEVVREKIEASAYGIEGIPQTNEEAEQLGRYFEFHIKVRRKDLTDTSPISEDEVEQLKAVSREFSQKYHIPVPLSYNENKDKTNADGKGHQRFLNVRFRKMGMQTIAPLVKAIEARINEVTDFTVSKVISEYVWFDTYNEMDHGWIDFTPEEFTTAYLDRVKKPIRVITDLEGQKDLDICDDPTEVIDIIKEFVKHARGNCDDFSNELVYYDYAHDSQISVKGDASDLELIKKSITESDWCCYDN